MDNYYLGIPLLILAKNGYILKINTYEFILYSNYNFQENFIWQTNSTKSHQIFFNDCQNPITNTSDKNHEYY